MNLTKMPNGRWKARISVGKDANGNYKYKSFTADTKKEAEMLANEYAVRSKAEQFVGKRLKDAMDEYNEVKDAVLSPSTMREYYRMADLFGEVGNAYMSKLTSIDLQKYFNNYHKTHTPKSTLNLISYVSSVFKFNGMVMPPVTPPQKEKIEYHIVTDDEARRLMELAKAWDRDVYNAIALAIFIPARKSEIMALTQNDVDRKTNVISISKAVVRCETGSYVQKPPKTFGSYRKVAMPKDIIDGLPTDTEQIIPMSTQALSGRFDTLMKKLGFHFRFHDLRHYGCSILLNRNVPIKEIMRRGGWTSQDTIFRIYGHTSESSENLASDTMTTAFTDLLG